MLTRDFVHDGHTNRVTITRSEAGWAVREERDDRVVRDINLPDRHCVERALEMLELKARKSSRRGTEDCGRRSPALRTSYSTNLYPNPTTVSIWSPAAPSFERRRPTWTSTDRVSMRLLVPPDPLEQVIAGQHAVAVFHEALQELNSRRVSRIGSPSTVTDTASKSATTCFPR